MNEESFSEWEEKYPFMSCIRVGDEDFYGIIQNSNKSTMTMYCFDRLSSDDHKKAFIVVGETWWWESNRQIPIDVFLFQELIPFRYAIRTFENKHIEVKFGPVTEINNLVKKRIKRRTITLVKNVPSKDSQ